MNHRLPSPSNRRLSAVPMNPAPEVAFAAGGRELDKFFKALSDRTRRSILHLLQRRELSVGEIVDNFNLSQPTISRHLSVLKEARLVTDRRNGQHVMYRLSGDALARSAGKFFVHFDDCQDLLTRD
ncbi:MAG: metalloregulator ArsR/SmtB family transcription factor [Thermoanaerobaculia bacterium]